MKLKLIKYQKAIEIIKNNLKKINIKTYKELLYFLKIIHKLIRSKQANSLQYQQNIINIYYTIINKNLLKYIAKNNKLKTLYLKHIYLINKFHRKYKKDIELKILCIIIHRLYKLPNINNEFINVNFKFKDKTVNFKTILKSIIQLINQNKDKSYIKNFTKNLN